MAESAAYTRHEIKGGVPATTLNGGVNSSATSVTITSATSWPTGSPGPFQVTFDRGLSTEEDAEVTSRSGNVLTVAAREINGTTAAAHADGSTIEVTWGKRGADEANYAVSELIGAIAAKGDLLVGDAANSADNLTVGANDTILMADSAQTLGVRWQAPATASEIADVTPAAESAGTSDTWARGDHKHLLNTGAATNTVATSETTTSTSFTDLATAGPAVTVTVGASGLLLVLWSVRMF